jgi:hypothetical protein
MWPISDSSRVQVSLVGRRSFQENLDADILASAERTADRRVDDPHLLLVQLQRVGDLPPILMRPLPGRLDYQLTRLVHIRQAGLGLEEGVFLPGRHILALDDDQIAPREGGHRIALAQLHMPKHVRPFRRMNQR